MKQLKNISVFCLVVGTDIEKKKIMFTKLQKWTFDGKFQICQISLLPTDSVILGHGVYLAPVGI
jgi:hypothetical protein